MNWALVAFGIFWMFGSIFGSSMEQETIGFAVTELNGAVNATATSITVDSTRDFPDAGWVIIGDEIIAYTGTTSTTFTGLTRGDRSTVAASHSDNANVYSEFSGLVNNSLNFNTVESNVPLVGEDVSLGTSVFLFAKFVGKIIIWDWPYLDGDFLGFPLYLIQTILAILSIGFIIRILYDIKQILNPLS